MANLTENKLWEGVYRLETADPLLGGDGGVLNKATQNLTNRTKYLYDTISEAGIPTAFTFGGDLNTLVRSGFFHVQSVATGQPVAGAEGFLTVNALNANSVVQVFSLLTSDKVYTRRNHAGSGGWQPWREMISDASIVCMIASFPFVPAGWLHCDGSLLSRTTYASLFIAANTNGAVVSESEWFSGRRGLFSSGNGVNNFRLPDLRGEFVRGFDAGRGVDAGRVLGSEQAQSIQSHTHTVTANATTDEGVGALVGGAPSQLDATVNSGATGGNETRPRNIALYYCVKY